MAKQEGLSEGMMQDFWLAFLDPRNLFAHASYILLITSMMMRSMRLLRILALGSGLAAMAHFIFQTRDFASLAWEIGFVSANLFQLGLLWVRARSDAFDHDAITLTRDVLRLSDPGAQRAVLAHVTWSQVEEGTLLIEYGDPAPPLIYVASGAASIERGETIIGVCGEGDFLGEMSLVSGGGASATVRAGTAMRLATFDRAALERLMQTSPEIAAGFTGAVGRGLAVKIDRMNDMIRGTSPQTPLSQPA